MAEESTYQSTTLEEYEPQLWSCLNCYCGLCVESCPSYRELKNEIVSARGLAQIGLALLTGDLKPEELSDEILFACTGCGWCEWVCSMNTPVYIQKHGTRATRVSGATMTEILRSHKIEQEGEIPKEIMDTLINLSEYGNPYGGVKRIKDDWVSELGLTLSDEETILYVGAMAPYEASAGKMAETIIEVLKAGNLPFAMLGSAERDSGAFARMLGEEGLFMDLVEQTTQVFKERKVKSIICLSPHDYDTFLHYYEDIDDIEIKHYTQILAEMITNGTLHFEKKLPKRVTYHDPCYLGRQNDIYEAPREILQSIPGLELIEMKRSKEDGFCCGGGGTGLFLDLPRICIDRSRADQINEVNPDCLAVACPICLQMLDAAMKSRNYAIEVKDIAQLVKEGL